MLRGLTLLKTDDSLLSPPRRDDDDVSPTGERRSGHSGRAHLPLQDFWAIIG
jgi:hypothetical protein